VFEHFDDKVAPIRTIFESGIGLIILCGSIHLKNFFSSFNAVENSYFGFVLLNFPARVPGTCSPCSIGHLEQGD